MIPPEILGPYAALAILFLACSWFAREHLKNDAKREALLDIATAGWKAQTDANATFAAKAKRRRPAVAAKKAT